jgi:hypothetical protein
MYNCLSIVEYHSSITKLDMLKRSGKYYSDCKEIK